MGGWLGRVKELFEIQFGANWEEHPYTAVVLAAGKSSFLLSRLLASKQQLREKGGEEAHITHRKSLFDVRSGLFCRHLCAARL
jgi:hypothetical protein